MLNRIVIHGRLARDPELRYTQSQVPVASFTVACDRHYTSDSGERGVDFIDVVAWRSTGEFVNKYFQKGSLIIVDGRLQSRKWTDKEGNKRVSWEINAEHCYFGGSKREDDGGGQSGSYQTPTPQQQAAQQGQPQTFTELDESDGELPF